MNDGPPNGFRNEQLEQMKDQNNAVSLHDQVYDEARCKAICGNLFSHELLWKKHAVNGTISVQKLKEFLLTQTDVFLTHDWGIDGQNHKHVSKINAKLSAKGLLTWFDEDKMEVNGHIFNLCL